jgi:hypothetical protein
MSTPALIYLALSMIGLGAVAAKDGQARTGKHTFFGQFVATAITYGLLYWGGFFNQVAHG